jgi:hydrogenase/urease accessory protein HupE
MNLPVLPGLALLVVISIVVPAVMVAFDLKLPPSAVALLAGLYGALHGLLNGFALASIGAGYMALLGIVISVLLLSLLISAAVVPLQGVWSRIAVRVAGSWVAAVGILMLGWLTQGNV